MPIHHKIFFLIILFIGFGLGYLSTQWTYFEIHTKVNVVDFIALVVNSFILIYIAIVVSEKGKSKRFGKEYLIKNLEELSIEIKKILVCDESNINRLKNKKIYKLDFDIAVSNLKKLSKISTRVENICKILKIEIEIAEIKYKINEFKKDLFDNEVNDGYIRVNSVDYSPLLNKSEKIELNILELILKVNIY